MSKCLRCDGKGIVQWLHNDKDVECVVCHGTGQAEPKRGTCPECKVKNGYHKETCLTHLNNCFPTPQVSEGKPSDKVTELKDILITMITWMGAYHNGLTIEECQNLIKRLETL